MIQGVITFQDKTGEVHIYRTKDALPHMTIERFMASRERAYKLPKYEATDSAAAFVAYTKLAVGDVKILPSGDWRDVTPPDARYRYVVSCSSDVLNVEAHAVHFDEPTDKWFERTLFSGTPEQFKVWADREKEGT